MNDIDLNDIKQMKSIKRIKIRNQLLIIFAVAAVLVLFLLSLFFLYAKQFKEQHSEISKLNELNNFITALEDKQSKFINIEKSNDDFIETGNSFYITEYISLTNNTYQTIDSLSRGIAQNSEEHIIALSIKNNLENNKNSFSELAAMIRDRGNMKNGIIKSTERALQRFSKQIEKHDKLSFLIAPLQKINSLRNIYYNKPNEKSKNELQKVIDNTGNIIFAMMEDSINSTDNDYIEVRNIFFLLKDSFNRLFENDYQIGYIKNEDSYIREHNLLLTTLHQQINSFISKIRENYQNEKNRLLAVIALLSLLLLLLILFAFFRIHSEILKPIERIKKYISQLSIGNLPEKIKVIGNNEISHIQNNINLLTNNLLRTKEFSKEVGKGNFNVDIEVFGSNSDMGIALHEMRESLEKVAVERQQQIDFEKKQSWINTGISNFNDILRRTTDDIDSLSYRIISKLTEYIDASQGAFFVTNTENPKDIFLELKAAYAYNRKKYINKKIRKGEELVGTCFLEKKTIYLDEIPDNYLEIRSGLGKVAPNKLLIVPLLLEDNVLGIIELASLKNIEKQHIEFVEKIANPIASTIANLKMNMRTASLLEKTRQQARELGEKEEQMRQSMQELRATQEASAKKEAEASGFVSAVNHTIIRADYNLDGKLEYANTKFLEFIGAALRDINNTYVNTIIDPNIRAEFDTEWKRVVEGGRHIEREMRYKTKEGYRWLLATYTSIKDLQNKPTRILFLAINVHEQKTLNLNIEGELTAISSTVIKADFNAKGLLEDYNEMFQLSLGYEEFELRNKNVLQFLRIEDRDEFKKLWQMAAAGEAFEMEQQIKNNRNKLKWFRGAYTPVKDFDNVVFKIVYIGYDISEQKNIESKEKKRAKQLEEQEKELRKNVQQLTDTQNQLEQKEAEHIRKIKNLNKQNKTQLDQLLQKDREMRGQLEAISKTNLMAEYDIHENILYVNQIFCDIFEYTADELQGKKHRILYDLSYSRTAEYKDFWKRLNAGIIVEGESVRVTKSGTEIYTNGVYFPMRNNDGKIHKILELAFDNTENKKRELEIAAKLNAIDLSNSMSEYKPDGTIISVNKNFCDLYDYQQKQLVGFNHKMLVDTTTANSAEYEKMWETLRGGQIIDDEFKRISSDGDEVFIKAVYNPIKNKHGIVTSVFELAFDITDNKELELDLKRRTQQMIAQEEMMKLNLEEMQSTQEEMEVKEAERTSLIHAIDKSTFAIELKLNGKIIKVSKRVEASLNKKAEEITGTFITDYIDNSVTTIEQHNDFWSKILNGEIEKRETKIVSDDNTLWLQETYSPIFDNEQRVIRVIDIAIDITEIKELQAKLDESNKAISIKQEELQKYIKDVKKLQAKLSNKEYEMRSIVKSIGKSALVIEINLEGYITNINLLALELFASMKSDLKNSKYNVINKEANIDFLIAELSKGVVIEQESKWEYNNKQAWVHETLSAVFDKDRNPIRIISIAFDITENKKQRQIVEKHLENITAKEEELRKTADKLQNAQNQLLQKTTRISNQTEAINRTNIMVIFESKGEIVEVNSLFCEIFGYKMEEITGNHYKILLPVKQRKPDVLKEQWSNLKNGIAREGEFLFINKSGDNIFLKGAFNPMKDNKQNTGNIMLLASDITKYKQ